MSRAFLSPLRFLQKSSHPSSPGAGDTYFNTTHNRVLTYTGTAWTGGGPLIDAQTVTTNASGVATVTFTVAFAAAPVVVLTCEDTDAAHPTIAEITSVSATTVSIRSFKLKNTSVVLGGTAIPSVLVAAVVHVVAVGA